MQSLSIPTCIEFYWYWYYGCWFNEETTIQCEQQACSILFWNLWQIYEYWVLHQALERSGLLKSHFKTSQLMVTSKGSKGRISCPFFGGFLPPHFSGHIKSHVSLLPFPQKKQQDPYTSPGELPTVCTWKSLQDDYLGSNPPKTPRIPVPAVKTGIPSFFYMFHSPGSIAVLLVPLGGIGSI